MGHRKVAETAVVGKPHPIKGQALVACVVLKSGEKSSDTLEKDFQKHVRDMIDPIAVPDELYVMEKLPKTRSGKIMRRVIRSLVSGQEIGDTTTLETGGGRGSPQVARRGRDWEGVSARRRIPIPSAHAPRVYHAPPQQ